MLTNTVKLSIVIEIIGIAVILSALIMELIVWEDVYRDIILVGSGILTFGGLILKKAEVIDAWAGEEPFKVID